MAMLSAATLQKISVAVPVSGTVATTTVVVFWNRVGGRLLRAYQIAIHK